jgi:hypothetical protein
MVVGVRQHIEAGPFQLSRNLRRGSRVGSARVGLRVTLELVDHGLKIGDRYVGTTDRVDQAEKVSVAHMRPRARDQRITGQKKRKLARHEKMRGHVLPTIQIYSAIHRVGHTALPVSVRTFGALSQGSGWAYSCR